ncbi:MAG: MaoC/PaaZ C-terminal domain-containing protein [Candidatus Promineifilaceae bacterium]
MTDQTHQPRGRYFEEFAVGDTIVTSGRTVTEADIVHFAGLSGDYTQIHTDAAYAASGMFGQRVAHGLLVLSIASGLAVQTGMVEGTVLAFRELAWKFSRPVTIGDTIRAEIEIIETKPVARLGGGSVDMKVNVRNQHDEIVHRGNWIMLVKSKDA